MLADFELVEHREPREKATLYSEAAIYLEEGQEMAVGMTTVVHATHLSDGVH